MKNSLFLLFILVFTACGKSESKKYFAQTTLSDFSAVINKKNVEKEVEKYQPSYIEDKDYYRGKIKLYLYDDQTFKFEFADYSTNEGEWKFEDNSLQLEGYLSWIPLDMYIFKKSADDKNFYLQFTDAQGTKTRNLEIKK